MFNFLDKLVGWFDRRFLIGYWMPVGIGLGGVALIVALQRGFTRVLAAVGKLGDLGQIVLALAVVVGITVLAYALQALTGPTVRLYEGYPLRGWLARTLRDGEENRFEAVLRKEEEQNADLSGERYFFFPPAYLPDPPADLRPTRLGNALMAAEAYPRKVYEIDSVLWWPRMSAVLPAAFQERLEGAVIAMVALLNLCSTFVALAVGGTVYLLGWTSSPVLFMIPAVGGLLLARVCYLAAVSQSASYGNLIRVAFDFYRHKILAEMRIEVPDELGEEMRIWSILTRWILYYRQPFDFRADDGTYPYLDGFPLVPPTPAPPAAPAGSPPAS